MTAPSLLVALGASLVLLGVLLRGAHQSLRRIESARAQAARLDRLAGHAAPTEPAPPPHPLRHRLPLLYRSAVLLGLLLLALGFAIR